tara:strand:- start:58 stop:864 length:807 start_codon:yes stop_codon:yes gene_type:complete
VNNLKRYRSYKAFLESPHPSFKHTTYFATYDDIFTKYIDKKITFVEVGVLGGGSLFMWRNFFGKQARIIGIDLNPEAKKWEKDGFEIFIGDQSDPDFWDDFYKKIGDIDILLDDGGHTYIQQIVTSEFALDNIKDGGVLVVEDTHTSYMEKFGDKSINFMRYVSKMIDKINTRFSQFNNTKNNKRVFSISLYESIVAFFKNNETILNESRPIWNKEPEKNQDDFRYKGKLSKEKIDKVQKIVNDTFTVNIEDKNELNPADELKLTLKD